MPTPDNKAVETSVPDYLPMEPPPNKLRKPQTTNPSSQPVDRESHGRATPTTRPLRHDSQDSTEQTSSNRPRSTNNSSIRQSELDREGRPITTSTPRTRRDSQDSTGRPPSTGHRQPSQATTNPGTQQQLGRDNRSTTTSTHSAQARPRRDSQDLKSRQSERELKKSQCDRSLPDAPITTTTTTTTAPATATKNRTPSSPIDRHDTKSELDMATSGSDSSESVTEGAEGIDNPDVLKEQEQSSTTKAMGSSKPTRIPVNSQSQKISYVAKATQGTAHRGGASTYQSPPGRPPNSQVLQGHLSEDEEMKQPRGATYRPGMHANAQITGHVPEDEMMGIRQPAQGSGYGMGFGALVSSLIMPGAGPPPPDKYQVLKEKFRQVVQDLENHKHELQRTRGEVRGLKHYINELQHDKQRCIEHINGLKNELNNVHQQLEDAKTLSEVRGKELLGAQVFLTKADTLSISEVGEKVTVLNEEIFQAAATLGEALIHKRSELSQAELDAAAAECQQMVGPKITSLLISQSQKPEPEVNPLLVQVVLQLFMVNFCVSKIQSWYPSDPGIGSFLTAIHSEIRSTEEQAVSGRWRALTRAHTRPSPETWRKELPQKLMSVLNTAAWTAATADQENFLHRLPPIFKAVNELRIAIGEKFTSADLDISIFDCESSYQPSFMDDAYGDGRQPSDKRAPELIVGTTGIGLKKAIMERNAKDVLRFENVISAKIVLESTLNEALEPVQPSSRLKRKKKPVENMADNSTNQEVRMRPKTAV